MTTHEVLIGPGARGGEIATTIDGRSGFFELGVERLAAQLLVDPPERLLDLLEIAGGVFAADGAIKRGPNERTDMGDLWRRSFLVHAEVREPEFWGRPDVRAGLSDLVDDMSEDDVEFEFGRARDPAPVQRYVPLDDAGDAVPFEDVVMFSGGLDSLAGAVETLETRGGRVALVTHLSSQKRMTLQNELGAELAARYRDRVLHVRLKARRRGGRKFVETTQRTRTLLFGAIGILVHDMLGGRRLSFFENGVVSQNLPITPQVIGTMATRTTHPRVMAKLRRLLALVRGTRAELRTPYQWETKTDVVRRLERYGAQDLISRAFSCNHVIDRRVSTPNCGACSQCLDRRVAVLAAGLERFDPVEDYETDPLIGERVNDRDVTMAVEWFRHARAMQGMTFHDLQSRFGTELAAISEGFPKRSVDDVTADTLDMQRRHGEAADRALTETVREHAQAIASGRLPATSPVRLASGDGGPPPAIEPRPTPDPTTPPASTTGPDPAPAGLFPLQVYLDADGPRGPWMRVARLGEVRARHVRIVGPLRVRHEDDRLAGRERDDCRYFSAGELARDLAITKQAAAMDVRRVRAALAELHAAVHGAPPAKALLIETGSPRGYRADPDTRFLAKPPGRDGDR